MTWRDAVDYATPHKNPKGLRAAGVEVVLRYAGSEAWKCLTGAERDALFGAGLEIFAMFEDAATTPLKGHAEGAADARKARAAWTALGYPAGDPIAYAVDFNATPGQLSGAVAQYVQGINSVEGTRDMEYGSKNTIDYLTAHKLSNGGFQTYAWSGGQWSSHATIEQYQNGVTVAGSVVDRCRILSTVTTWKHKAAAPAPSAPVVHPATKVYEVRSGDSMSKIAGAHGMTLPELEKMNPHAGHPAGNFDLIRPGDKLTVKA